MIAEPITATGTDSPIDFQRAQQERRRYHMTEGGNADRLYDAWGSDFRWVPEFGEKGFIVWTGKRWEKNYSAMLAYARRTIQAIFREGAKLAVEAAKCEDEGQREKLAAEAQSLIGWARRSDTDHMVKAMLSLVRTDCLLHADVLDQHPMWLNCPNGTVDLNTGRMRAHRRQDFLTQMTAVDYDPNAKAPVWERFISESMCGRDDLVMFLQQYFGSALTGDVSEHCWALNIGGGRNGKSVAHEAVTNTLGDYGLIMSPESIVKATHARGGNAASPDLAALAGKRFVTLTETEEGDLIAAALIKRLTGGDEITARRLYEDQVTFKPTWHLSVYTNYKPRVRDNTDGFWDRVRLVPWEHRVSLKQADHGLPAKLRAEAAGILAWLVRGCLAWQQAGTLPYPDIMQQAAMQYRGEQDIITLFVAEACVKGSTEDTNATGLYKAYVEWAQNEANERPMVRRTFRGLMEQHGYTKAHHRDGWYWQGLRLRLPQDPEPGTPADSDEATGEHAANNPTQADPPSPTSVQQVTPTAPAADTPTAAHVPTCDAGVSDGTLASEPRDAALLASYRRQPWYSARNPEGTLSQALMWAAGDDLDLVMALYRAPLMRNLWTSGGATCGEGRHNFTGLSLVNALATAIRDGNGRQVANLAALVGVNYTAPATAQREGGAACQ